MAKSREKIVLALISSLSISMIMLVRISISATQAAAPAVQTVKQRSFDVSTGPLLAAPVWGAGRSLASLEVAKTASPQPVLDGAQLTYTLQITNTGGVTLTATITDVLPAQVTASGHQAWTALIKPGGAWTHTLVVTVTEGYTGLLTNQVQVTTAEGASGTARITTCANLCSAALPLVLREHSSDLPPRDWDPRLDDLGVTLQPAPIEPGQPHWRLVAAQWADPIESVGRHNIFFEVLDENGERATGQPVIVEWRGGDLTIFMKPGPPPEWGADFPMFNTLGSYDSFVGGGAPSDRVTGMGMGTVEHPDFTFHTSFYLTFRWIP